MVPVRPTPVATSSAIISAPNSSHSARTPCRKAMSWVSIPAAACTIGSTMTADTDEPSRSSRARSSATTSSARAAEPTGSPGEETWRVSSRIGR
jgi:hypothetical protein